MARLRARRAAMLGLFASTTLTTAAYAQDATPGILAATTAPISQNVGVGADIVVTAQRRSENIQRVPISLQALTPAILDAHQVQALDDYTKLLPSVSFQSLGPNQSQLFFRGITSGADGNVFGAQPTSGVYLDDVPVTTIGTLLDIHIYDVARLEALSGPQGTLFGANSLSGTLRIITNKPDPSALKGGYDLQLNKFGDGKAGGLAEGFVNVPLAQHMALRVVGFHQRDGGYIDNTYKSRTYQRQHTLEDGTVVSDPLTVNNASEVKKNFNTVETYGGRLALGIELDDNWTVTPSVTAQKQHGRGTFLYDPRSGDLKVHDFSPDYTRDKWYQAALTVQGKIKNWDVIYSGGYMSRRNEIAQDYSYYTVATDEYPDYTYFQTADGTAIDPSQRVRLTNGYTKQTHELRLSSPAGERFNVTTGLFYQRQRDHYQSAYAVPGVGTSLQAANYIGDDFYLDNAVRVDRDYAVFGQADFHIIPSVTLTGGIRGFKYRNTVVGFSGFAATVVDVGCGTYTPSCQSLDRKAKGSGETHKLSVAWQIDPQHMVYATYSTGFRPGGINRPVGYAPYDKDTLSNYEMGFKTTWFDHRLRLNGAFYYERWNGIQYGLTDPVGNVTSFVNAGDANVYGVELDGELRLGGFTFSATGTYNDAKLANAFCDTVEGIRRCDLGIAAPKGTRLPIQPKFKSTLTTRYDFDAGDLKPFVQVSMLHQSDSTNRLVTGEQDLLGNNPGFTTFDASGGLTLASGMSVQIFIQNMFDKRAQLSRNTFCSSSDCFANYRIYPLKPQLFGVKVGQRF